MRFVRKKKPFSFFILHSSILLCCLIFFQKTYILFVFKKTNITSKKKNKTLIKFPSTNVEKYDTC